MTKQPEIARIPPAGSAARISLALALIPPPRVFRITDWRTRAGRNRSGRLATSLGILGAAVGLLAADAPALDPQLEPLRPLIERTWRGPFKNSTPEKPVIDVMRWERALNGKAVRMLHSINDGAYGGETIFRWDRTRNAVTYHYFTTAGFMTTGTLECRDGKFLSREVVAGDSGGVTEVRATSELAADGTFVVRSEHLKDGNWQPARETVYREDSSARVVFR
jgi:hypothetical protein